VLLLVVGVAAAAAAALLLPVSQLPGRLDGFGVLAPIAGVAVGAALLAALMPRTPISLACGALFGATMGVATALAISFLAAVVTFAAGRALGQAYLARTAGARWEKISRWVVRDGVLAVAAVRALPLGPYGFVGYAYGASPVRVRDYALGTLIAGTPSGITYALVGAAVASPDALTPLALVPLAFSLTLTTVVVTRARRVARTARAPLVEETALGEEQAGELLGPGQERRMVAG
jgi:uncharacterized membrane protein YdjX (TVP38/TMEM64 family)